MDKALLYVYKVLRFFRTYSLNFSEPWFGGKKPISFNTSLSHTLNNFGFDSRTRDVNRSQGFNITSLSVGIAKRLTVPDDLFCIISKFIFSILRFKQL